jgi:hypothetical protein
MVGTWDVAMTFWTRPGGPGVTTRGTSTIQLLLNGLIIEHRDYWNPAAFDRQVKI